MWTKRFVLTSLAVTGLLLGSCAPAAAPTPTPKPAAPPTTEAPVPAAPKEAAPTAKPAAPTAKPAAPSLTPKPAVEQPRYGGIVTRALSRDVASFDVQREQGADASTTIFNVYQGLARIHPIEHEKIVPELAGKWEVSPDGKAYTFKFYKGIKWHDGEPFTMEDVKYSLERMHNPKAFNTIAPRGESLLAAMDSAEIVGEDTIKIVLKYPSASFLLNIATGWVAILPKHILVAKGDMRRDSVGTGPFKLKRFIPDISLELSKNQNYHVKGLPYLDGIAFYTIKDDATRFSAFRTGRVQITFIGSKALTATEAEIVKREMADKAVVYEHDGLTRYVITFNVRRKPWDDTRARKAVDLAIDRQAAIAVNKKGYVGSIYPTPWGMKPEDVAKLPGYRQPKDADIAEARKLLTEAGLPSGFKTTLLSISGGTLEAMGVITKAELAKAGLDVEIVIVDNTTLFERTNLRQFDMFIAGRTDTTGDPDETLFTYYKTGGSRNFGDFSNREIDALIDQQARTLDVKAREAILAEIERKSVELAPTVIFFWDVWRAGAWKEVRNWSPGPGNFPWGKLDYVWLAK